MVPRYPWVAAPGLACLLSTSGCGAAPALPRPGPDHVIPAFGDSLTCGTGATPSESYPAILARPTVRGAVRKARSGETTAWAMQPRHGTLDAHAPGRVAHCLGGNDLPRRIDDVTIAANPRHRIASIRAGAAAGLCWGLAREHDRVVETDIVPDVPRRPEFESDPVHPNAGGYRRRAQAVAKPFAAAGAARAP